MNILPKIFIHKNMEKKQYMNICKKNGEKYLFIDTPLSVKYMELYDFINKNHIKNVDKNTDVFDLILFISKQYSNTNLNSISVFDNHIKTLRNDELWNTFLNIGSLCYTTYQIYSFLKKTQPDNKLKYVPILLFVLYIGYLLYTTFSINFIDREIEDLQKLGWLLKNSSENSDVCLNLPKNYKRTNSLFSEMLNFKKNEVVKNFNEITNNCHTIKINQVEKNNSNDITKIIKYAKEEVNADVNADVNAYVNADVKEEEVNVDIKEEVNADTKEEEVNADVNADVNVDTKEEIIDIVNNTENKENEKKNKQKNKQNKKNNNKSNKKNVKNNVKKNVR